ncbi:MAG: Ig-like domain-containing protein [Roseobacter sp.]
MLSKERHQTATGPNHIKTDGGNDVITSGNGDNIIHAGAGANRIRVGDGENEIEVGDADDRIAVGDGGNQVVAGDGDNLVVAGNGQNIITTGNGADKIYVGTGGNDIRAGMGNDYILAAGGNNEIYGEDGDDIIRTGSGDDKIWGGQGNDKLFGGDGYDVAYYAGSFADYTLARSSSNVSVSGTGVAGTDQLYGFEAVYFEGDDVLITLSADAPPILYADHIQAEDSAPLALSMTVLLENDFGLEDLQSTFTVSAFSSAGVRVAFDGENITYNADDVLRYLGEGEIFQDSFTYAIIDPVAGAIEAAVNVTITGENDAPVAMDDRLFRAVPNPATYEGNEVVTVNTNLAGFQLDPSMASFSDGKSVFVWEDGSVIKARVLNADGTEFSADFQINEQIGGAPRDPAVTVLANGNFVVSWNNTSTSSPEIYPLSARVFAPDGSALTPDFSVNNGDTHHQIRPQITALENSGFVISWTELNSQTKDWNIKAAIFDDNGAKTTSEFVLNKETSSAQQYENISVLPGGGFIATWFSYDGADPSGSGIKARTFDSSGKVIIDEFLINETTNGYQGFPTVSAREDGSFAVVWYTQEDGYDYKGRIFKADGAEASPEFQINGIDLRVGIQSSADWLPSGHLIVTWLENPPDDSRNVQGQIKARIFNDDGTVAVEEFIVSDQPAQNHPEISVLSDGRFVIAWSSGYDAETGHDIKSRTYEFGDMIEEQPFTSEDNPITIRVADLMTNDSDIDADTLAFSLDSATSKFGALLTYDPVTGDLMYDPSVSGVLQAMNEGDVLEDQFTYTVSDGNDGSDQATVTLLIGGKDGVDVVIDENPVANDDYLASGGMTHSPELVARSEFTVNESNARWHSSPFMAQTADGGSIAVWHATGGDDSEVGIRARILDASGNEVVSEFKVDVDSEYVGNPVVALLEDSKFVVAWSSGTLTVSTDLYGMPTGAISHAVILRVFNADGTAATEEFKAAEMVDGSQTDPQIVALDDGNYAVSWTETPSSGLSSSVKGVVLDAEGARITDAFPLSGTTQATYRHDQKIAARPDGGFIATWRVSEDEGDMGFGGIKARILDNDGKEVVSEFLVNTTAAGYQNAPDISVDSDGNFVIL